MNTAQYILAGITGLLISTGTAFNNIHLTVIGCSLLISGTFSVTLHEVSEQ